MLYDFLDLYLESVKAIDLPFVNVFLGFTQSQETQKTIGLAAMLESQTKEIIKILLLRVLQHGRHDVRWNPAIVLKEHWMKSLQII